VASRWTDEQLKAIDERNKDILVSAAAGSGKTAVLVERIIKIITDKENPVDIDRLLVLTFTKAAASEMRERIGARILSMLKEDPKDINLKNQLTLLNKAQIATIHSFCMEVVKKNYASIGIDPVFRVADDAERGIIETDVMDEMFEEKYAAGDEGFLTLIESFDSGFKDSGLKGVISDIYDFVRSTPFPDKWIDEMVERYNATAADSFEDTFFGKMMREEIARRLIWAAESIEAAIDLANMKEPYKGPEEYIPALLSDIELIGELSNGLDRSIKDFEEVLDGVKFKALSRRKSATDEMIAEEVKALRNADKKIIEDISKKIVFKDIDVIESDIDDIYPFIKELGELVKEYNRRFDEAKRKKQLMDFNDLEHYCLKALVNEDSTITDCAKSLREKYYEILTDEYQDSNHVQEIILRAVSKGCNRFMVGDVKQSIYKFRMAMPAIFMEKYNTYTADGEKEIRIDLYKNFRSRKNVLDGINFVFENLMSPELGELVYDEDARLDAGASFEGGVDDKIVFDIIEKDTVETNADNDDENDIAWAEIEAIHIAGRIKELMAKDFMVTDRATGNLKKAKYKDIAILMRSPGTVTHIFEDVFEAEGIPLKTDTSSGFFNTTEIMTIVNFLKVIDNPRQDIPLISVLYSPVYDLDANDLMTIRLDGGKKDFYTCIKKYSQDGENERIRKILKAFFEDIEGFRKEAGRISIAELILKIYNETGYFDMAGAMTDGKLRQANLRLMIQKAEGYEEANFHGLFNFIKYVERIKTTGTDIGEAKTDAGEENSVSLMTVHKSKGLEYPIVFVSGLGKKFNKLDSAKSVLMHQTLGFGIKKFDYKRRVVFETAARKLISETIIREGLSEELRILYVALTRARDKLYLVGTVPDIRKKAKKWAECMFFDKLPYHILLKATGFIDWLGPCIMRHKDGKELLESSGIDGTVLRSKISDDKSEWEINFIDDVFTVKVCEQDEAEYETEKEEINEDIIKSIVDNVKWKYPFENASLMPANVSISELKRIWQERFEPDEGENRQFIAERGFEYPDFDCEEGIVSSLRKGTVMHALMEQLDFKEDIDEETIKATLDMMVAKSLITREEAETVRIEKIISFFKTDISRRMKNSRAIYKEEPFAMTLDSEEAFGERFEGVKEKVLLHGIIDCYFEEDDGLVLIDYKTDRIRDKDEMRRRYKIQLDMYKKAIEKATGKNVKEVFIYLFDTDEFMDMR